MCHVKVTDMTYEFFSNICETLQFLSWTWQGYNLGYRQYAADEITEDEGYFKP